MYNYNDVNELMDYVAKLEKQIIDLKFQIASLKLQNSNIVQEQFNDYIHALPLTQNNEEKKKEIPAERTTRLHRTARIRNKRAKVSK